MTWTQFFEHLLFYFLFFRCSATSLYVLQPLLLKLQLLLKITQLCLFLPCFCLGWENRQPVVLRTGRFVRVVRVWVRETKNCMDLDQSLLIANSERCLGTFFFCILQGASQRGRTSILMPEKYTGCSQNLVLCLAANEAKPNLSLKICNLEFGGRMRILLLLYIRLLEFLISSSSRNDQNNLQFPKYIMPIHASY